MGNGLVRVGLWLGTGGDMRLLTVAGRKTGKPMSTPVTLVIEGGEQWLVAPYGERQWVKNLRAAGTATLSKGRSKRTFTAHELAAEEAVPVLRRYVKQVPITRHYWDVTPESPDEEYMVEATKHPVFAIEYQG